MTEIDTGSPAACPGCLIDPGTAGGTIDRARTTGGVDVILSLPAIHCAACISGVERALMARDDVRDVRVNLTRKRATVNLDPEAATAPEDLADHLSAIGFEALPLDTAVLTAGESDARARDLLMRLGVSGFSMMNVMLLSVAVWSGAEDATRDLFHWISAAIALPTVAFSGQPFFKSAWSALRHRRLNMDVPISLGIFLACGISLYETANSGVHAYFDAALSLTFFLLAGRFLDQKMRSAARSAAAELAALESPTALKLGEDGAPRTVPLAEVVVGDRLLVRPGMRIPADGTIETGESELDRAILTGETDPVAAAPGMDVRAGEVNLTGPLTVVATAVGKDTALHALADLVSIAEESKSRYNSLADRASRLYSPIVHIFALSGFLFWMWITGGDVRVAVNVAVALLIITCPCALGLAVPAVSTVASGLLFRAGLLVKHPTALERLAEVDRVVFDKTGTLTMGDPRLADADTFSPETLALAAALAEGSAHPRSRAIAAAAADRRLTLPKVTAIREVPGYGVEAQFAGQRVRLGRASWVGATGSGTCLAVGDAAPETFRFEDNLRPGAFELVSTLKAQGLPVMLLSGDAEGPVAELAERLGIADWRAGVLPEDKARIVSELSGRVLMLGDGLNDTAALAAAHVSIAPASALEAARVAADVVLTSSDLAPVSTALRIGATARRRILQNFGVAAIYNMVSIPIAFAGLATPLAAAIAMSTSSIVVSLNAMRTR